VVSVTDPYGSILGFLDRSRYLYSGALSPGRETDNSFLTSAEINKKWIYSSTLPIRLHGIVLN
jgi:hypothetical protein